ncbi:hypothetical protein QQF64_008473 [Cirrhinus molitorella]|uniref:Uncharacterized protein n=1 Tax=Cirrhinus molitorella TaxID=172907 RepID=A0ABR3M694_9TELE
MSAAGRSVNYHRLFLTRKRCPPAPVSELEWRNGGSLEVESSAWIISGLRSSFRGGGGGFLPSVFAEGTELNGNEE